MATVVLIVIVFIFCEFGQRMINISARAADDFMRLDWYMLPPSVQNGLPLILAGIQEPISINGLGSIACTREAFKTVNHLICTINCHAQHFNANQFVISRCVQRYIHTIQHYNISNENKTFWWRKICEWQMLYFVNGHLCKFISYF